MKTVFAWMGLLTAALAADKPAAITTPTVADALKVFDAEKLPLLKTKEPTRIRSRLTGGFTYYAIDTNPKAAFEFHQRDLTKQKWKELPNGSITESSCNGSFTKDGYVLVVNTHDSRKDGTLVTFHNLSNLNLKKLPAPTGAKPLYSFPSVEAHVTPQEKETTVAEVTKLLRAQGWEPYGTAGDQHFFRKNAVRLSANIMMAPAQNNQTAVTYSAEQLSTEIPAPHPTVQLQYSDSTKRLFFEYAADDLEEGAAAIFQFYQDALGKLGWKSTTDEPIVDGGKRMVIYRNPAKEMLTLYIVDFEDKLRVDVEHQSAAEVAAIDAEIDAAIAAKKKEAQEKADKGKNPPAMPKLSLSLPADAKTTEVTKSEWKCALGKGKSKPLAEALHKQLKADGWKARTVTLDAMFGLVLLEKGDLEVRITYVETGVIPPEFTITGDGVELEVAKAKK